MTTILIDRDYREGRRGASPRRPVMHHVAGEPTLMDAYIEMSYQGVVTPVWSAIAYPASGFSDRGDLLWPIDPALTASDLDALLDEIADDLAIVHAGYAIVSDTPEFTQSASAAGRRIEGACGAAVPTIWDETIDGEHPLDDVLCKSSRPAPQRGARRR